MSALSPSPALHQRVLRAACDLFLENGYQVSMEAVAQRAGVSKQTVYAHFASKDGLFRAAIEALVQPLHASLDPASDNLPGCLLALARASLQHARQPHALALGRMLVSEAPRFPREARELYRAGSGALLQRLATLLDRHMHEGELRRDDPGVAAELFMSMLNGLEAERRLLGMRGRGRSAQDEWARHAVNVFMRAYAPVSPTFDSSPRKSP